MTSGVTAPSGFLAAGSACGIKDGGRSDLALVATSDHRGVPAAAVFTQTRASAAPVVVSRRHLTETSGRAAAVVLNSGNANAATGSAGIDAAEQMCQMVAERLGCATTEVLVCQTGLIGIPFPLDRVESGIPALVDSLSPSGGEQAAEAIMTTDTVPKQVAIQGASYTIGGMAKGAAMLAPNMATMLAVLTTDAAIDGRRLRRALGAAVEDSFNALTVDGCTSTNDTVIVLASGTAGPPDDAERFEHDLADACADLALQMAGDAEGATKVVRVTVRGAASVEQARRAARQVAESQLVKCSWYGCDPYWGRVAAELGVAPGVAFELDRLSVSYGGVEVCRGGVAIAHDEAALALHMAQRELDVVADLGVGSGMSTVLTNDLTHAYVDENMGTS